MQLAEQTLTRRPSTEIADPLEGRLRRLATDDASGSGHDIRNRTALRLSAGTRVTQRFAAQGPGRIDSPRLDGPTTSGHVVSSNSSLGWKGALVAGHRGRGRGSADHDVCGYRDVSRFEAWFRDPLQEQVDGDFAHEA